MRLNGKNLKVVATAGFNAKYGGMEAGMYTALAQQVLLDHPVDMLVFEMADKNHQRIRSAGYYMFGKHEGVLDEETVVYKAESLPTDTFWFKVDDYGDHYLGTFLFPDEY